MYLLLAADKQQSSAKQSAGKQSSSGKQSMAGKPSGGKRTEKLRLYRLAIVSTCNVSLLVHMYKLHR